MTLFHLNFHLSPLRGEGEFVLTEGVFMTEHIAFEAYMKIVKQLEAIESQTPTPVVSFKTLSDAPFRRDGVMSLPLDNPLMHCLANIPADSYRFSFRIKSRPSYDSEQLFLRGVVGATD